MAYTIEAFGDEFTNVTGIKATDDNDNVVAFIKPVGTKSISANGTGIDVAEYASVDVSVPSGQPTLQNKTKTYTPTTSQQTESVTADSGYDGLETVNITVNAMAESELTRFEAVKRAIGHGEVVVTPYLSMTAGYVPDVTDLAGTSINVMPELQDKENINPTTSSQTIYADSGYDALNSVQINAIPSGTEGTPTATKGTVSNHAVTVTPSVTNTTGYISGGTKTGTAVSVSASELVSGTYTVDSSGTKDVTNYASASVPSGTAGTPSANKGAVSNHSVSVTPSVTNTTGWITGSAKTGTAVTVSASELVSGTLSISDNGTSDCTNYASVNVSIPFVTYYTGTSDPSSSLGSNGDIYLKVVS